MNNSPYPLQCQRVEDEFEDNQARRISCPPGVTGSIVRVVHSDPGRVLELREVLVFGSYGKMTFICVDVDT